MGTITNKAIEKLDEKLAVQNGNGDIPNIIKVVKLSQKKIEKLEIQVSILSAK